MRLLFARLARQSARVAHQLTSQVVVSVATAVCVALISNAYLRQDSPSTQAAPAATLSRPEPKAQATTVIARKAARPPAAGPTDTSDAGSGAPVAKALADTLPKLEAVYIPTIPPAATPVVAMQVPPPMASRDWDQPPAPDLQAHAGDLSGPAGEEPKRVRVLGIPLPGVGAARDRLSAFFGADR